MLLAAEHVVGRLVRSHLALQASFISTAHALLRWTGEFWELRDLGSKNGTYVDDQRVAVGTSVRLGPGVEIVFGEASETWQMVDDRGPAPAAVPLDGGDASLMKSGTILVPTGADPLASIHAEGEGWVLEMDERTRPLEPGQEFEVAGRQWRFDCATGAAQTRASEIPWKRLSEVELVFGVSRNEEHVALKVRTGLIEQDLGERGAFYLALVLVEHRLKERDEGLNEPGWLEVHELLEMVPEYTSSSHVNVAVCRLRQLLHAAGVQDAPRVIERRRGQLRFGTDRVQILRESVGAEPLP